MLRMLDLDGLRGRSLLSNREFPVPPVKNESDLELAWKQRFIYEDKHIFYLS